MSGKALKVVVEINFRAVSCPGVRLPNKDDLYLSVCFLGQYRQSVYLPAVFPLLFNEKMIFEKIFKHALNPGDIAVILEYETVRIELVQLASPVGDTLAVYEENAQRFLFPEPRLVPSFTGVDQELLMIRDPYFPGISPRLEFSTKTTITECSPNAEANIYPNVLMRPPQRNHLQKLAKQQNSRTNQSLPSIPRSQSPSMRPGKNQHSSNSATPVPAHMDTANNNQPTVSLWRGTGRSESANRSADLTNSIFSSPSTVIRSASSVRFSPTGREMSFSNGLLGGNSEDDSSSSETQDLQNVHRGLECPSEWWSDVEQARHSRSPFTSHREWEDVHERVRALLTTPRAVRRLLYGASFTEVDRALARTSIISPGPPIGFL